MFHFKAGGRGESPTERGGTAHTGNKDKLSSGKKKGIS